MSDVTKFAGGRATEAGMSFQAAVTAWFAAQLLADVPVGAQFGLPSTLRVISIQCETGDALDDVVVRLEGGSAIYTQCKTRPSLSTDPDSLLAKAIRQLVELHFRCGEVALTTTPNAALLAVAENAPRSLDSLEAGCRMFDHGGDWDSVVAEVPNDKHDALSLFELHVRTAWADSSTVPPTSDELVALARLFRIQRFAEDASSLSWREASHLIGRRLFGGDHAGDAPMSALLGLSRKFIRTGAPMDRLGLLRALRAEGHVDTAAPAHDADIAALLAYSDGERNRLRKHTRLPLGAGIPILRDCLDPLLVAIAGGSLLVTGEPGAGKTGILLSLAERLANGPGPVVFLSVERFSGFTKRSDFRAELALEHDPIDLLAAWPGTDPGVLIVDALDASRGGPSEPIVAGFIEDAVSNVGARWSIVASIRSFDLLNGQRFRQIMPGLPPNATFAEAGAGNVRHFHVPRLSLGELAAVSEAAPALSELVRTAPPKLGELLLNIFNLSLAAELLDAGVQPQLIRKVATQSELIRKYEDIRLPSQALRLAVKAAVTVMVQRRQLAVRAVDINSDALDSVRQAGVLVTAGDRVAFAHHVLFDHIAGRFYLMWDDTEALRAQLSGDPSIGLVLGPALRFALEQVWQEDGTERPKTWRFLADLSAASVPDPVVVSIALRTAAERVEVPTDVESLCSMVATATDVRAVARLLSQLARFVGMVVDSGGSLPAPAALAWSTVARAVATAGNLYLADTARVLLMTLAESADLGDPSVSEMFGQAARGLLQSAWSFDPENPALTTASIRFVTKSYGSDPAASRILLNRILDDRFQKHASEEAPWLAEGVPSIIPHDPFFVALIYATLFTRDVTDEGTTWMGGSPSRILQLTSTHRQDYEHARWHLTEALKSFLDVAPIEGTTAVVGAVRGVDAKSRQSRAHETALTTLEVDGQSVKIVDDLLSLEDWRKERTRDEKPLTAFVEFLKSCSQEAFRDAVSTTLALPANAAVWARILGIAADRLDVSDVLWPLVSNPHFVALQGLARDAIIFLAAAYPQRSIEGRATFENAALAEGLFTDGRETRWWRSVLARFLSTVPREQLATPAMVALRDEMEAAGKLTGNEPLVSITVGWGSDENVVDSMLKSAGADFERSPDREIREASRKVEERVKRGTEEPDVGALVALWSDTRELVEALDAAAAAEPNAQLVHSSWGAVSNGVERLAKSSAYAPGADGLPDLNALLGLIDRLSTSQYPEPAADGPSDMMSWGNWDVRVYAASSLVALAPRFARERMDIVDRMQTCLRDPTPSVRMQVVQALNVLWNVAHDRMWSLVSEVTERETHEGVLGSFVAGPMWPLSREYPERCAGILAQLLEREWVSGTRDSGKGRGDRGNETYASLAAFLFVARDQHKMWLWIERWASDVLRGGTYLASMLHNLRKVFFFPYSAEPKPEQLEMARRARQVLDVVVRAATTTIAEARPHLLGAPDEATVARWRPPYVAADSLIHDICNQLYFGSGAFRSQPENDGGPGLATSFAKQRFLVDYSTVLDSIAAHAQARTVYHLFELLAYLVDGDPAGVFDRIAKMLLGPAAKDGYQFESLGLNSLVKLVRRYLADHRDIFDNPDRRQKLVEVLELFSSVGWPDALKLLFELPDLLR